MNERKLNTLLVSFIYFHSISRNLNAFYFYIQTKQVNKYLLYFFNGFFVLNLLSFLGYRKDLISRRRNRNGVLILSGA